MTVLDELLTRTGEVHGVTPPELARGRKVVMAAAQGHRVRAPRVPVGRKLAFAAVGAAAAGAIAIPFAAADHQAARVDPGRPPSGSQNVGPIPVAPSDRLSVQVAGYVVVLPAGYRLAPAGSTNCNAGLSPTRGTRIVPPGGADECPLDIESVTATLPSDATPSTHTGVRFAPTGSTTTRVTFYAVFAQPRATLYFPARLADGNTVYVTVAAHGVGAGGARIGRAITVDQATQLADGLTVTATKACTTPSGC